LEKLGILLHNTWDSLNDGDLELDWLLSDDWVTEVVLQSDLFENVEQVLEVLLEISWLNISDVIELNHSIFQNGLLILVESVLDNHSHFLEKWGELLGVGSLSNLQILGKGLHRRKLNVKIGVTQSLVEDLVELVLTLDEDVHHVSEQSIEDGQSSVLLVGVSVSYEFVQDLHQVSPWSLGHFVNSSSDFNDKVTDLLDKVSRHWLLQNFKSISGHLLLGFSAQSLPEVFVVFVVGQILRVNGGV
jgi:hypothetical protein